MNDLVEARRDVPSREGAARNSAAVFAAQGLGGALTFASTLVTLHVLRRPDFGILAAAFAFIDPIRTLSNLGVDAVGVRRAAVKREDLPRVTGSLLLLRTVLACFAVLVAVVASLLLRAEAPGGSQTTMAAALVILPAAFSGTFQVPFQATQSMQRLLGVPLLVASIQLTTTLTLAKLGAPVIMFAAIPALAEIANAYATRHLAQKILNAPLVGDVRLAKDMLREGLALAYVSIVVVVYTRGGYFVLEALPGHTVEERSSFVADLGAANNLIAPLLLLGAALFVSFTTYCAHLVAEARFEEFRAYFVSFVRKALFYLVPVAIAAVFAIPPILRMWKPEYEGAGRAFRYLAFGGIAMLLCQVSSACLIALERARVIAWLATLNIAVFFAIAMPLAPSMHAEGVAIATCAMETLNAILQVGIVFAILNQRIKEGRVH